MTLSSLLLGAGQGRPRWVEVGGSMIAVDTLVHGFLHRTGILNRLNAGHRYGPICYQLTGCVGVLEAISQCIDARTFNHAFPPFSRGSSNMPSGDTAPSWVLTFAMAIESTIAAVVQMYTAVFSPNVIA
jgi:hypothetical protein